MADLLAPRDVLRERWMGWRIRLLLIGALLGCLSVFLLARLLAGLPNVEASFTENAQRQVILASSTDPALKAKVGQVLTGVGVDDGFGSMAVTPVDSLMTQRSARWLVSDDERQRYRAMHKELSALLAQDQVHLLFADGDVEITPKPQGISGFGPLFWPVAALALLLYLWSLVAIASSPRERNVLFGAMACCQVGNLCFIAVESTMELGLPEGFAEWDMHARTAFDLFTAAAMVHAASLHPRKVHGLGGFVAACWLIVVLLVWLDATHRLPHAWTVTQTAAGLLGFASILVLIRSYRLEPHPFALVMQRVAITVFTGWTLLTATVALAQGSGLQHQVAAQGSVAYYIFLAVALMSLPFLYKSQRMIREFALLAAIGTAATVLDLVFLSVFAFGGFASLTLALFLSLSAYAGARQWILNQVLGTSMLTAERLFEQLYRSARAVEASPAEAPRVVTGLLRNVFEPMAVEMVEGTQAHGLSRVVGAGSALIVPVPDLTRPHDEEPTLLPVAVVLRFARRGRRLFTSEDGRFADRLIEQLRRAVAFDQAVEQGRSEERMRLAQDLHDDIGARLLTLIYQSPTPEMEEYLRHTLGDLKTLTRGLSATNHRLSHACSEWKADLTQRLTAARIRLLWSASADRDPMLSVVQWSALTRVLRELVSNAIAHSHCTQVEIDLRLQDGQLLLTVVDNGDGSNPSSWAHGLGLGGVRKRVKQLGGEVAWMAASPQGICCKVRMENWIEVTTPIR
ncbi:MAG: histidine kinase [Rhizobacter sp.]|nr:histidine kinase [Rhizobacter sp.]